MEYGDYEVSLSSSGSILVISILNQIKIFSFDETLHEWFETVHKFPNLKSPEKNGSSIEEDRWQTFAISADAVTVAIMKSTSINIYRLNETDTSTCNDDDVLFNFTILPDKFQEDISWSLKQKSGEIIIGGDLSSSKSADENSLVFTYCLPDNDNTYYELKLEDDYGDGICCDWGNGKLWVQWDNKLVMNETGFTSVRTIYLPPSLVFASLKLNITTINGENDVIIWQIRNAFQRVLVDGIVNGNCNYLEEWSLPANECLTFVIHNKVSNDGLTFYEISWNDKVVQSRGKEKVIEKVRMGNCDNQICSEGYFPFELDILTNSSLRDLKWFLKTQSHIVLFGYDKYTLAHEHFYHRQCVPEGCLILQLSNVYSTGGIVNYNADMNGTSLVNTEINGGINEHYFRDCLISECEDGFTLLQFEFETREFPDQLVWKLMNSSNDTLIRGDNFTDFFSFRHNEYCIAVDECSTFVVSGYGDTFFTLRWSNESHVGTGIPGYFNNSYNIFC